MDVDRITQLQICLDQLATQMFASIRYINTHHAASSIPDQQFATNFPGQTPLNASSLPPQLQPQSQPQSDTQTQPPSTNANTAVTTDANITIPAPPNHINGTSHPHNSHTHLNGTASVPGSIPGTPAALRDGLDTRPGTPHASTPQPSTLPLTSTVPPTTTTNNTTTTRDPSQPPNPDPNPTDDPSDAPLRPDTPTTFASALQELARDLVLKEQQIEALIRDLPGRERTVEEQESRIRELDAELRYWTTEVEKAEVERRELLALVERGIMGVSRW